MDRMLVPADLAREPPWSECHRPVRPQAISAWCAFRPAAWTRTAPVVDLVEGAVRWNPTQSPPARRKIALDDTIYEPDAIRHAGLVREVSSAGTACVAQVTTAEWATGQVDFTEAGRDRVLVVVDPLADLLDSGLGLGGLGLGGLGLGTVRFSDDASRVALLLPLVAGLVEGERLQRQIEAAVAAGFRTVVPLELGLEPPDLRSLADLLGLGGEERLRLFHAGPPRVREVRRLLSAAGVRWWFEPLESGASPRRRRVRRISRYLDLFAHLAACAGRPPGLVEGHRQAARRLEEGDVDVRELLRCDDLHVLDWIDRRAASTLVRWFTEDPTMEEEPSGLARLQREAVADSPASVEEPGDDRADATGAR